MKKLSGILLAVCILAVAGNAQTDTTFKLIRIVKGDIAAFTVDNLDNIYILNSRNQLKKFNTNGDSVAIFNEVRKFGQVTFMDVSNPLKVLLYYKDFSTVLMLDRFLNIRNTIDLRKQNLFQVKAIGQSYDNKIWVYDELENKLKKIDESGKLMQETSDFRLLLGQAPSPLKIFDENKYVYLYDSLQGVYVFDYYGALKNNILITRWNNFKVAGKYIFGSRSDTLYRYEISTFQYDEWKMPEEIFRSKAFNFSSSRLYALKNDGIEIYSFR
jgi:glutaredoxin-related protein